jgi:biotin carboxyl carrier protein
MYRVTANNKTYEIEPLEEGFTINEEQLICDVIQVEPGYFHIISDKKSYTAEVVKADVAAKTFTIKINGRVYPLVIKDRFDLLLEKMGINGSTAGKVNNIKAPMPGLIIDLKVKAGDSVKVGEPILILEAMKMENIIKSPGEGVVKSVKIKKGDSVEKNQVLIEF